MVITSTWIVRKALFSADLMNYFISSARAFSLTLCTRFSDACGSETIKNTISAGLLRIHTQVAYAIHILLTQLLTNICMCSLYFKGSAKTMTWAWSWIYFIWNSMCPILIMINIFRRWLMHRASSSTSERKPSCSVVTRFECHEYRLIYLRYLYPENAKDSTTPVV